MMKAFFAVGIILGLSLGIGEAANSSYYCQYTSAIDKKMIFTLYKNGDTISHVYAKGKSGTCGTAVAGFVQGNGTADYPYIFTIDLNQPIQVSSCGVQQSKNIYTVTLVTQASSLVVQGTDKQYSLECNMTTPTTSSTASLGSISIPSGGSITDGTSTKVTPTTQMELLDQTSATPGTVVTAAKLGTKVALRFKLTSAATGGPQGIWIGNCLAGSDDKFTTQMGFVGATGCGVAAAAIINSKKGFKGTSGGAVADSPQFTMFQFPTATTIAFKCTVNYCFAANDPRCLTPNQCVSARRKRSAELLDVLRVKRAAGDSPTSTTVTKTFLVRVDETLQACKKAAQKGNTNVIPTKDCLTSVGFLTTVVVLTVLVFISLAAALLFYRRAVDVHRKQ